MLKKYALLLCVIYLALPLWGGSKKIVYGLSLGFFYTDNNYNRYETNIEDQVDSITLAMSNIKFGCLLNGEYKLGKYLGAGLENGVLFNNYHINIPFRVYGRFGSNSISLKPVAGISYIREVTYKGYGMKDIENGVSLEYGGRIEAFHIYFEYLYSKSLSDYFLDSSKISFGYSLFFGNLR